jgi:hypothetical protein
MKIRHLAVLLLILATTTPARAGDYWIGSYTYDIAGAHVRSSVYCQQDHRISIYELTATDTLAHRYWLLFHETEIPSVDIAHSGLVAIVATDMIWIAHPLGAIARVAVRIPGCWPRDEDPLEPRYLRWLPWVIK